MKSSQKTNRRRLTALPLTRCLVALALFVAMPTAYAISSMGFPEKPTASITSIDKSGGVITAKESATGRFFQFKLTNPALLQSLSVGQAIFADLSNKLVSLDGSRINGNIVAFGPIDGKPLGPVDGAKTFGPIDGVKPAGPVDGAKPGGTNLGPVDGAKFPAAIPQETVGPLAGRPAGPVDGAHPAPVIDGGVTACTITSIDSSRGLITARVNQTGRTFQFRPSSASYLQSLNVGQPVIIEFATKQVSLTINGNRTIIGSMVTTGGTATQK